MKPENQYYKGFTLLELLLVIAIVAILATVVLLAINPARMIEESRLATAKAALNQIAKASQMYETNYGELPGDTPRNIPTEFQPYLGSGDWPNAPWPGSVYDWDNWTVWTSAIDSCWEGSRDIIQITVRDVKNFQGKTYSTQAQPITGRPQLALYYVVRGKGVPHCTTQGTVGYCMNCESLYTPAP
jgi:prepilin-type N-terminal cleavage/methylation domain-containing protein